MTSNRRLLSYLASSHYQYPYDLCSITRAKTFELHRFCIHQLLSLRSSKQYTERDQVLAYPNWADVANVTISACS